jgi:hypothetical protein
MFRGQTAYLNLYSGKLNLACRLSEERFIVVRRFTGKERTLINQHATKTDAGEKLINQRATKTDPLPLTSLSFTRTTQNKPLRATPTVEMAVVKAFPIRNLRTASVW